MLPQTWEEAKNAIACRLRVGDRVHPLADHRRWENVVVWIDDGVNEEPEQFLRMGSGVGKCDTVSLLPADQVPLLPSEPENLSTLLTTERKTPRLQPHNWWRTVHANHEHWRNGATGIWFLSIDGNSGIDMNTPDGPVAQHWNIWPVHSLSPREGEPVGNPRRRAAVTDGCVTWNHLQIAYNILRQQDGILATAARPNEPHRPHGRTVIIGALFYYLFRDVRRVPSPAGCPGGANVHLKVDVVRDNWAGHGDFLRNAPVQ